MVQPEAAAVLFHSFYTKYLATETSDQLMVLIREKKIMRTSIRIWQCQPVSVSDCLTPCASSVPVEGLFSVTALIKNGRKIFHCAI